MAESNKRYEFMSTDWVKALGRRYKELLGDKKVDFECVYALEYSDPPAHLLRDDGRNTIGYTLLARHGNVEVIDGARIAVADMVFTARYYPIGTTYHMPVDEFKKWWVENEARLKAEKNFSYYGVRNDLAQKFGTIFPNNIYQDLYNVITAPPAK